MRAVPEIEDELVNRVEDLGYELSMCIGPAVDDVLCSSSGLIVPTQFRVRALQLTTVHL